MLPVDTKAPEFSLFSTTDKKLSNKDFLGKKLLLVFYPADFSPVCGDQLALYNEMTGIFDSYNLQIAGVSVDSKWCHAGYSETRNLDITLLADFEPKGEVSKKYEAYDETEGTSLRALYLINEEGIIKWRYMSPIDENPGADGILQALESMP